MRRGRFATAHRLLSALGAPLSQRLGRDCSQAARPGRSVGSSSNGTSWTVRRQKPSGLAPRFARGCSSSGPSSAAAETISLDDIEVELVGWDDHQHHHHGSSAGSGGADHQQQQQQQQQQNPNHHADGTNYGHHDNARSGGGGPSGSFHTATRSAHSADASFASSTISAVDPFAKSKVLNFLKRAFRDRGWKFDSAAAFETEPHEVERADGGTVAAFRCRVKLICPHPHQLKFGEGIAANAKDAETVAAMHAERVLDALGVPLYALPSMQTRHAEAARAAGRWAPLPTDGVRPADTPLPPPLTLALGSLSDAAASAGGGAAAASASAPPGDAGDASAGPAAAPTVAGVGLGAPAEFVDGTETVAGGPTAASVRSSSVFLRDHYHHAAAAAEHWRGMSATSAASAGMYDLSEGGIFQPCSLISTRFAATDLAVTLPIIYDKGARKRVAAYMRHHGQDLDRSVRSTIVPVKGTSYRMHSVELRAADGIVARGKALEKNAAVDLAAMHAELLIDFHGKLLFPDDAAKQREHARLARGYGRWAAMDAADAVASRPAASSPLTEPLPIKQTIGPANDNEGFAAFGVAGPWRCYSERIIMVHNELSLQWNNTFVEVNPPQAVLDEARAAIRDFMHDIGCAYPELYVCTRMGEFVRASIVLPLPEEHGLRGGNSVGRTPEQAMDLAALHAVDVLCALGVPVYGNDPEKQRAFESRRAAAGQIVTPAVFGDPAGGDPVAASTGMAPPPRASPRLIAPPGYYIEGSLERPLPRHSDVLHALDMPLRDANVIPGTPEAIVERGNAQKPHVQAYMRGALGLPATAVTEVTPTVIQTGSSPTVRNVVYLQVPLPREEFGEGSFVLAIGHGLKKKDADRACFMHAYALLEANGVDMKTQKEREIHRTRASKRLVKGAVLSPPPPRKKNNKAPPAGEATADGAAPPILETPPPSTAAGEADGAVDASSPSPPEPVASDAAAEAPSADEVAAVPPKQPVFVAPLMHPLLDALLLREAEAAEIKRSRPRLFSDRA